MYKVAVLMSVYNGINYLKEQVESVLSQNTVDVDLYIRDDGSKDETKQFLKNNYSANSKIHIFIEENVGVGNSFMNLLYAVPNEYEFYAFADQDDVWLSNKLEKAIGCIKDERDICLYASNQIVVDSKLENKHLRFSKCPGINFGEIIRGNVISGCTFVFNEKLFNFLKDEKHRPSNDLLQKRIHDVWVAEIAALFGKIVYDNDSYILYRQHGNNVVGAMEFSVFEKAKRRIKKLFRSLENGKFLCEELKRLFFDRLPSEKLNAINTYILYKGSILNKLELISLKDYFKHKEESKLEYILKIFFNKL